MIASTAQTARAPHLIVEGGHALFGEIDAAGSKNATLPIMAAAILARGDVVLDRIPDISDVRVMADILRGLGVQVDFLGAGRLRINADGLSTTTAPYELVGRMNASFDVAGPLLARFGEAHVALPGGCNLGQRRVNLHIDAFRALGADVHREHGMVEAKAAGLTGARIYFPRVSVGATKNAMMAATLALGETIIEPAACEPEIVDLAAFLIRCGARIEGAGTPRLVVQGVKELHGCAYEVSPDRIETGTLLVMAAASGGEVTVRRCVPEHVEAVLAELQKAGQHVEVRGDAISIKSVRPIRPLEVTTAPYPAFPTDLHPPLVALLVLADGVSIMHETIFDGRFMYVGELVRLGANIRVSDHTAVITGVPWLAGAPVAACDIRAGGAIIAAALAAQGVTTIAGLEFIDRGYEAIHTRLVGLGARIRRVQA